MNEKTIKRNWLKKQIELGKIEIKCELHLTDDYRFDVSNEFGKSDWMPARIRKPVFSMVTVNGYEMERCTNDDWKAGYMNLHEGDFEGKPGYAYRKEDGTITLKIHSNLYYTLREIN